MPDPDRSFLSRFLTFDEFLTIQFIRYVFLVGLALSVLGAMAAFLSVMLSSYQAFGQSPILGIVFFVFGSGATLVGSLLGIILWRVYCECLVVVFRINENLQAIKDSKAIA